MIFKVFRNKGSGSATASVNYLIGKNRDREKATLLKGDIEVTRQLAESLDFKNRYTVGVLSFEERDLSAKAKQEIIEDFEKTMFAGLEQDQYSIAWVEHRDKDRLELNFFIANVELRTGKRLQPYYDRADRGLIKAWKDVINHEYHLSDPNDPQKTLDLKPNQSLPRTKDELRQVIHDTIKQEVLDGKITNRDEVIAHMEQMGLEIARTTKTAVSIKDPDGGQNIRFKGEYYEQNFRIDENYTADQDRASDSYRTGERERIQRARAELTSRIEKKREYNQTRYSEPTPTAVKNHELSTESNSIYRDFGSSSNRVDDLQRYFDNESNRFTATNHSLRTQTSGFDRANHQTQGQKLNEPVFSTIKRTYTRIGKRADTTTEHATTAERVNREIDERKSSVQSTVGAIKQEIERISEQQHDFGARFSEVDREIKQREQQAERANQTARELEKNLKNERNHGFGR